VYPADIRPRPTTTTPVPGEVIPSVSNGHVHVYEDTTGWISLAGPTGASGVLVTYSSPWSPTGYNWPPKTTPHPVTKSPQPGNIVLGGDEPFMYMGSGEWTSLASHTGAAGPPGFSTMRQATSDPPGCKK
jgi:hypothetical protein